MQRNNWKKCKLGDALNFHRGYDLPKDQMTGLGYPVVGSNGIIGHHDKYTTLAPCLVIGRSGNTGKPAIYNFPCWTHNTTLYVDDFKKNNPQFLYYLLKTMKLGSYATGSAVPTLNRNHIHLLEIHLPPIDEQKRIADILGVFDDKIELLQKQNKTLEEMAKAIFKSWFVDFDVVRAKEQGRSKADIMREYHLTEELYDLFPSSFEDSLLGPIPSGWKVSNLAAVCLQCQSGGTPSTRRSEYWKNGTITWFSTKELQDSFLLDSEKKITQLGLNNSSAKLFPAGTVVMAIYASPTVGRLGILTKEATFNQAAVGFIPNEKIISKEYLFLLLKFRRDDLNNLANGAAQQNLSVSVVKTFNILIANRKMNANYKQLVSPLFDRMELNAKQIQTLTELRDSLLPRLISGKIRV